MTSLRIKDGNVIKKTSPLYNVMMDILSKPCEDEGKREPPPPPIKKQKIDLDKMKEIDLDEIVNNLKKQKLNLEKQKT